MSIFKRMKLAFQLYWKCFVEAPKEAKGYDTEVDGNFTDEWRRLP